MSIRIVNNSDIRIINESDSNASFYLGGIDWGKSVSSDLRMHQGNIDYVDNLDSKIDLRRQSEPTYSGHHSSKADLRRQSEPTVFGRHSYHEFSDQDLIRFFQESIFLSYFENNSREKIQILFESEYFKFCEESNDVKHIPKVDIKNMGACSLNYSETNDLSNYFSNNLWLTHSKLLDFSQSRILSKNILKAYSRQKPVACDNYNLSPDIHIMKIIHDLFDFYIGRLFCYSSFKRIHKYSEVYNFAIDDRMVKSSVLSYNDTILLIDVFFEIFTNNIKFIFDAEGLNDIVSTCNDEYNPFDGMEL